MRGEVFINCLSEFKCGRSDPRPAALNSSTGNGFSSSGRNSDSFRVRSWTISSVVTVALFVSPCVPVSAAVSLSHEDAMRIGRKVWQNECGGTVAGLTSWNTGENFASLGIGHFIWYPAGARGPFEESFPPFVRYVE